MYNPAQKSHRRRRRVQCTRCCCCCNSSRRVARARVTAVPATPTPAYTLGARVRIRSAVSLALVSSDGVREVRTSGEPMARRLSRAASDPHPLIRSRPSFARALTLSHSLSFSLREARARYSLFLFAPSLPLSHSPLVFFLSSSRLPPSPSDGCGGGIIRLRSVFLSQADSGVLLAPARVLPLLTTRVLSSPSLLSARERAGAGVRVCGSECPLAPIAPFYELPGLGYPSRSHQRTKHKCLSLYPAPLLVPLVIIRSAPNLFLFPRLSRSLAPTPHTLTPRV